MRRHDTYHQAQGDASVAVDDHSGALDSALIGCVRRHHDYSYWTQPHRRLRDLLQRCLWLCAQDLDPSAGDCHPAVRLACAHAGVQDEVLEPGRRGPGSGWWSCHGRLHDSPWRQDSQPSAHSVHGCVFDSRRRGLGAYPRALQGQVEHKRDAVHAHDELCGNAASCLLHHRVGGAKGFGQDRHHQPVHRGWLAPADWQLQVPAQHHPCGHHYRFDVRLPQVHQARI